MKFLYLFLFSLLFACPPAHGQEVPLGSWKDYLSYRNGISVTMGNGVVYCVAGAGLFSYNTSDNSVERLNKVTGLSDVSPTVARCNPTGNILVIGYADGNIDIMQNNAITNIPDLLNSTVQGGKEINCIYFPPNTNYALIGCGQGIIQFDLTQDVILNTYYIGTLGAALNVRGITIYQDSIFATTDVGISKAAVNDPNLNNYSDWIREPSPTIPYGVYTSIVTIGDSLYTIFSYFKTSTLGLPGRDTVLVYSNGLWTRLKTKDHGLGATILDGNTTVYSLETAHVHNKDYLIACTLYTLNVYDISGDTAIAILGQYVINSQPTSVNAFDGLIDANMNFWVADNVLGLVKATLPYFVASTFTPQGPYNNQVFDMAISNNNLWVVAGAYDANITAESDPVGASVLENGTWTYLPSKSGVNDLVSIAVDPWNPLHAFAGSWGSGLEEFNNNTVVNIWDSSNSTIQNVDVANYKNFRIGGIAYDTLGDVWVTNSLVVSKFLVVEKPDLSWKAIDFGAIIPQQSSVTSMIVTQSQAKWMIFNNRGILAYQDNGTFASPGTNGASAELITPVAGNGGLPDATINCMAQDLNGSIWVGTDERVVVFYSPDNVYDGNKDWDAQPVYVTQNGYTQYLMQNQNTTCIAVDGANQKWIGTQGGGVFLMSADGTQQIYNFTTSNSPLLSNNIQQIVINPNNGEVFFATDQGIVSYKGSATEGTPQFGSVYAYPDPVPHGYSGPIAIKNLAVNSDIKITTVNGELVYHTIAEGGQAIWNGNNFEGTRVQTGVYLVFCVSPDGSQTKVTKLLFMN